MGDDINKIGRVDPKAPRGSRRGSAMGVTHREALLDLDDVERGVLVGVLIVGHDLRARTGPRRVTPRRLPGRADTPGTGTPAERRRWGPAAALTVAVRLARATGRTAEAARPNEAVLAMGDVDTHAENRRDERRARVILVATRAPRLALSTVSTAFSWLRCAGRFPRSTTSPWLGTVQIESAVHEK